MIFFGLILKEENDFGASGSGCDLVKYPECHWHLGFGNWLRLEWRFARTQLEMAHSRTAQIQIKSLFSHTAANLCHPGLFRPTIFNRYLVYIIRLDGSLYSVVLVIRKENEWSGQPRA